MTDRVVRLQVLVVAVAVFLVLWAAVAARPWTTPKPDPRVEQLAAREARLERESLRVQRLVEQRWADYRSALAAREQQLASQPAPSVAPAPQARIVTLPPLVVTRSS
ncbi:MAG TPA: hypothetical protein VLB86_14525 [Gaiellaceae bacterium]|nr:hypothetical protein [Gaiellaceae bacterium]